MKKILLLFCLLFSLSLHAVTINVSSPGTLTNLITAEDKATITDLTLTGNIDVRDVKCMRDELKNLAILDISEVNIIAYTGTSGTAASSSTIYPANEMPANSFYDPDWIANTSLKTIKLPNSITSIGNSAFESCKGLSGTLMIPNSVITIGESAFKSCNGISGDLVFPNSVTSIGGGSFYNCRGLDGILKLSSSLTSIGRYAFWNCIGLNGLLTIPDNVKRIEEDAFYDCSGFTGNLKLSNSLTSIGAEAFAYCNGLTGTLTIPSTVTALGVGAFDNCTGFSGDLTLPNSITTIENNTFTGCSGFTGNLRIPNSVTSIGNNAFSFCSGFTKISVDNAVPPVVQSSTFDLINKYGCTVEVPAGAITAYQAANYWKEFATIVEFVLLPSITTSSVSSITTTSASSGGNITIAGTSPVTTRGVCWSTTANPTISDSKTADGVGTGVFSSSITGLTAGLTYHIRAYATTDLGTSYGSDLTFSTLVSSPTVITTAASFVNSTGATSGGNVTSVGSSPVTARGVCWSTAANPTISDSKTIDGVGYGVFTSSITGLPSGITYHIRAYATNDFGTSYGSDLTFTTIGSAPTVITTAASTIHSTTAISGGNITSEGSSPVTSRGVCWSTTANPTTSNSKTIDGNALGTFVSSMTGLTPNTTYHFRAYATNGVGTSYGDDLTFKTLVNDSTVIINVSTAGSLSTLISAADKATITNLTLTGSIDARDVKCLRDEMPLLTSLNMREVSIQAYTGTAGTSINTWTITYPANEMPESSFKLKSYSNYHLKEIYFPKTITSIGENAFDGCAGLTNIVIPEKVTTIRSWAFRCCYGLINIAISASVSTIGDNAFRFCYINKAYNVASDNPYYSSMDGVLYNKDKTVLICFPEGKEGDFVVPNSVTSIANSAFRENHLKNITIPTTVSSIGSYAFMDSYYLTQITIPSSIVTIAEYSFSYCEKLTSITIPASVTTIEYSAFYGDNSISEYKVESANPNYTSVDGILFDKNKTILVQFPSAKTNNSYSIPNSVTTLSDASFFECMNLTTVFIPNSVSAIKGSAFYGCKNLATIVVDKATPINLSTSYNTFYSVDKAKCVLYVPIGSKAAYQAAEQWKEFTNIVEGVPPTVVTSLPNSITTNTVIVGGNVISEGAYPVIGRGVCWSTSANPTIANSKTTDGTGSGEFSSSITGLASYVSYYVRAYATTSIGTYYSDDVTFTTLATTINVATAGTLSSLISSTDKTTLTKLILTGNIDARDVKCMRDELTNLAVLDISGVNIIAYSGIDGTQSGSASTIYPANEMPNSSFSNPNKNAGKNSLKSISLPKSITSIGASAFGYCKGLNVDFEIPNSVTSIGNGVFFGCENIKSVMLGSKVTSIGLSAFNQCKALTAFSVDLENLNYSSSEGILFNKNKTILIQYPSAKQGVSYTIPNTVTSIGDAAFGYCLKLTDVIIPNSVTSIGYGAFSSSYYLTNITIPNSVTSLGGYVFGDCRSLTNVSISNKVTLIPSQAFDGCIKLSSIVIPNSVKRIDFYAFDNCAKLTSVTIPKSVTSIGSSTFSNCGSLTSVYAFGTTPVDLSSGSSPNVFNGVDKSACTLYVPLGSKSAYQTAAQWKDFLNIVEIFPPSVSTGLPGSITTTGAMLTSTVTAEGSAPVTARGVCWSTSANPTIANNITSDGSGVGEFTSSLTGLVSGFTYHIRAYATNDIGTAYGDDLTFTTVYTGPTVTTASASGITRISAISGGEVTSSGTSTVTGRGVCWSTLPNPTIADNKTIDGVGVGMFSSTITGLTSGVTYHFRSYATTSASTSYGSDLTFTTVGTAPTVTTAKASSITNTTAISGGNVTNVGTSTVTARGVCWSITANPTIADNKTTDGTGAGLFSSSLTGLTSGLTYHIRAYATSDVGTSYGSDITILTTTTGITDEKMELITLYPNPVSDDLRVKGFEGSGSFSMTDISGRVIIDKRIVSDELIDISSLPKGVYIVKIVTINGTIEKKVIKK